MNYMLQSLLSMHHLSLVLVLNSFCISTPSSNLSSVIGKARFISKVTSQKLKYLSSGPQLQF